MTKTSSELSASEKLAIEYWRSFLDAVFQIKIQDGIIVQINTAAEAFKNRQSIPVYELTVAEAEIISLVREAKYGLLVVYVLNGIP